jgi:hypothetical protein
MLYGMELQHIGAYSRVVSRSRMIPAVCLKLQNVSISTQLGGMIETLDVSGSSEDAKVRAYIGATTGVLKNAYLETTVKI